LSFFGLRSWSRKPHFSWPRKPHFSRPRKPHFSRPRKPAVGRVKRTNKKAACVIHSTCSWLLELGTALQRCLAPWPGRIQIQAPSPAGCLGSSCSETAFQLAQGPGDLLLVLVRTGQHTRTVRWSYNLIRRCGVSMPATAGDRLCVSSSRSVAVWAACPVGRPYTDQHGDLHRTAGPLLRGGLIFNRAPALPRRALCLFRSIAEVVGGG
jgi:hypothetical protein